jgi:hypothetical protein
VLTIPTVLPNSPTISVSAPLSKGRRLSPRIPHRALKPPIQAPLRLPKSQRRRTVQLQASRSLPRHPPPLVLLSRSGHLSLVKESTPRNPGIWMTERSMDGRVMLLMDNIGSQTRTASMMTMKTTRRMLRAMILARRSAWRMGRQVVGGRGRGRGRR